MQITIRKHVPDFKIPGEKQRRTKSTTVEAMTEAQFRRAVRVGIEDALAPFKQQIAAALKAAKPATVKAGVNRGKMMRKMTVMNTGRSL